MKEAPKYFAFENGINSDSLKELIAFVNDTPGELVIGMNSAGGDTAMAAFLSRQLDANRERITLVLLTGAMSAQFMLFANFRGKRAMTAGATGMFHRSMRKATLNDNGTIAYTDEAALQKSGRQSKGVSKKFAKSLMTEKEYKNYKKGKDVFFAFKRMKELFPDAEIWE